jgi:hypothetical protein
MTDRIFNVDGENRLQEMARSGFLTEDVFQRLLADHPALLGGAAGETPLLIRREQPVVDDGGSRWSLDHLYVDPNGVPILVEVKRASDTRTRREVVAQMLDYAANGTQYWKIGDIIKSFKDTCLSKKQNPEEVIGRFLGEGYDPKVFWQTVEDNLRQGKIRMMFVADEIPRELRRIIEFLNEQMRPAEVLAVQLTNYQGIDGTRTLVPFVIGATERANTAKAAPESSEALSPDEWLEQLGADQGAPTLEAAKRVVDWFRSKGCDVGPTASQDAFYIRELTDDGKFAYPFFIRRSSGGRLETSLQYLQTRPAFASEEDRRRLHERLRALPKLDVRSTGRLTGWPSFDVAKLLDDEAWEAFQAYADEVLQRAKSAEAGGDAQ